MGKQKKGGGSKANVGRKKKEVKMGDRVVIPVTPEEKEILKRFFGRNLAKKTREFWLAQMKPVTIRKPITINDMGIKDRKPVLFLNAEGQVREVEIEGRYFTPSEIPDEQSQLKSDIVTMSLEQLKEKYTVIMYDPEL